MFQPAPSLQHDASTKFFLKNRLWLALCRRGVSTGRPVLPRQASGGLNERFYLPFISFHVPVRRCDRFFSVLLPLGGGGGGRRGWLWWSVLVVFVRLWWWWCCCCSNSSSSSNSNSSSSSSSSFCFLLVCPPSRRWRRQRGLPTANALLALMLMADTCGQAIYLGQINKSQGTHTCKYTSFPW